MRFLDVIDLDAVRSDPKPILGYSDILPLNLVLPARSGLVDFHADLATLAWEEHSCEPLRGAGPSCDLYVRLLTTTEPIGALPTTSVWEYWRPGRAAEIAAHRRDAEDSPSG